MNRELIKKTGLGAGIIIALVIGAAILVFGRPQDMYRDTGQVGSYEYCRCRGFTRMRTGTGRPLNFSGVCYGRLYDCRTYLSPIKWE